MVFLISRLSICEISLIYFICSMKWKWWVVYWFWSRPM